MTMFKRTGEAAASRFRLPDLPERLRGGRVEKWADFWKNVLRDYGEAVVEVRDGSVKRPLRAACIAGALGGAWYLNKQNPDERSFRDSFAAFSHELALVPQSIMNRYSARLEESVRGALDCGEVKR